jgi:hypothetical protein
MIRSGEKAFFTVVLASSKKRNGVTTVVRSREREIMLVAQGMWK